MNDFYCWWRAIRLLTREFLFQRKLGYRDATLYCRSLHSISYSFQEANVEVARDISRDNNDPLVTGISYEVIVEGVKTTYKVPILPEIPCDKMTLLSGTDGIFIRTHSSGIQTRGVLNIHSTFYQEE